MNTNLHNDDAHADETPTESNLTVDDVAVENFIPTALVKWSDLMPQPTEKKFAVLKVPTPKLWMPKKATSTPPAFIENLPGHLLCDMVIKYNRRAIERDNNTWANLCRTKGGHCRVYKVELPRHYRPNGPNQFHPLCEEVGKTWEVAFQRTIGINRKLMYHAHSPKLWAVVVTAIPPESCTGLNRKCGCRKASWKTVADSAPMNVGTTDTL